MLNLTENDLKELSVKMGHRKKILTLIGEIKGIKPGESGIQKQALSSSAPSVSIPPTTPWKGGIPSQWRSSLNHPSHQMKNTDFSNKINNNNNNINNNINNNNRQTASKSFSNFHQDNSAKDESDLDTLAQKLSSICINSEEEQNEDRESLMALIKYLE